MCINFMIWMYWNVLPLAVLRRWRQEEGCPTFQSPRTVVSASLRTKYQNHKDFGILSVFMITSDCGCLSALYVFCLDPLSACLYMISETFCACCVESRFLYGTHLTFNAPQLQSKQFVADLALLLRVRLAKPYEYKL